MPITWRFQRSCPTGVIGPHDYRFLSMGLARGYDVTLLTYRKDLAEAGLEGRHYDVRDLKGLKIRHNPALAANTLVNLLRRVVEIKRIIREEKPDVLHAGWLLTSGFLAALSGFHPYLLMPWGSDIIHFARTPRWRFVVSYTVARADMITCDCEYEKRILVDDFRYPAERILVMPWDVDLRFFHRDNRDPELRKRLGLEGKKVLLMTRIFRPEYGIEDFIRALAIVKDRCPDAAAVILGYGPLEGKLKALASDLGLDSIIRWTGYVPQDEVVRYINIADIYVSTSLMDGSSSSLLEAMACGLPAVVTDIPGNTEWIREGVNGLVARRSDAQSIADAIVRLLEDDKMREAMSAANRRMVDEKADFSKNFSKLEAVYKQLAAQGKRAS